jgi:hypothetical protein
MRNKKCFAISAVCFCISVLACSFQILALHAINYCYSEPLMHLYYPVLTLVSLTSTIAILGTCVNQAHVLLNRELPPFATALGTPVLVICATVHLAHIGFEHLQQKYSGIGDEQQSISRTYEASKPFC